MPIVPEKRCTKCGQSKPHSEFGTCKSYKDGLKYWCRICEREYAKAYYETPEGNAKRKTIQQRYRDKDGGESLRRNSRRHYWSNPEANREYHSIYRKEYNDKNRSSILRLLGDACKRCGFKDVRALQIDHVHGGGTAERRAKRCEDYYRYLLKLPIETLLGDYQCLCANCNWIKRHENNEVPRRKIRLK